MKPIVLIVRAPESHGRPERLIGDSIVAAFNAADADLELIEFQPEVAAPENGVAVYADLNVYIAEFHSWLGEIMTEINKRDATVAAVVFVDGALPIVNTFNTVWDMTETDYRPLTFGVAHSSVVIGADILSGHEHHHYQEQATLNALDTVFVATSYLYKALRVNNIKRERLCVLGGLPIVDGDVTERSVEHPGIGPELTVKADDGRKLLSFVWNHRLSDDKGFGRAMNLLSEIDTLLAAGEYKDDDGILGQVSGVHLRIHSPVSLPATVGKDLTFATEVIITSSREAYLASLLPGFYLNMADLETFGYATLEGVVAGTGIPLVPDVGPFNEIYRKEFRVVSKALMAGRLKTRDVRDFLWSLRKLARKADRATLRSPLQKGAARRIIDAGTMIVTEVTRKISKRQAKALKRQEKLNKDVVVRMGDHRPDTFTEARLAS